MSITVEYNFTSPFDIFLDLDSVMHFIHCIFYLYHICDLLKYASYWPHQGH